MSLSSVTSFQSKFKLEVTMEYIARKESLCIVVSIS